MSLNRRQIRWNGWAASEIAPALGESAWRWLAESMAMPALLATPARPLHDAVIAPTRLTAAAQERLKSILGASGLKLDGADRASHASRRGTADLLRLRAADLANAPDAVLYPRNEDDVLALVKLCAELDIAVLPFGGGTGGGTLPAQGSHAAQVALDLSALSRVTMLDFVSGQAMVEAGILGPELERQLAARGLMLGHRPAAFEFSTLGGWIAAPDAGPAPHWLAGVRLATPQGMLVLRDGSAASLNGLVQGSQGALGVITAATLRIRPRPAQQDHRRYLFPDFASGIAALRQAAREGLPMLQPLLRDDGATRLAQRLSQQDGGWTLPSLVQALHRTLRRFDGNAAALDVSFGGNASELASARKRFDALARKLGALPQGVETQAPLALPVLRDILLDRGAALDSLSGFVTWAKLPLLYVALRAALKQAMRAHALRPGVRGLVLFHVGPVAGDGAGFTASWIYPRQLDDEVAQAEHLRAAALAAAAAQGVLLSGSDGLAQPRDALEERLLGGIKRTLDPGDILNPGHIKL